MSLSPPMTPARPDEPRKLEWIGVTPRELVGFLAMVFGMFMAILDIQIVSASLSEIQAGLSASADEIPWVQTAYLIAEVVMIPLSGFLSQLLSTRILFSIAAAGFTLSSLLCATATDIDQMIIYRAIQGFIGGGMIPSVFAVAYSLFPAEKRGIVSTLIGLVATLAPTIGPTVGGYLSNTLSWHWLFLVNIAPGIIVTVAVATLVDVDKPNWRLLDRFDFAGLVSMAVFLGSLEYVLEEGPRNDWFGDGTISLFSGLTLAAGVAFFWRTLTASQPIVDLRAFKDRNFAFGCAFSFVLGIGFYSLPYLYPIFLARVRGYNSLQIGEAMFLAGVAMVLSAPLAGRLSQLMDLRHMVFLGFMTFAAGTWVASGITSEWQFGELVIPQILRGCSLMLCIVPINNLSLGTLPPAQLKNASGLYNLTRNLGGAVGLALINTLLNTRLDLHLARLHEGMSWGHAKAEETLAGLTERFSGLGEPEQAAMKQLSRIVHVQAEVMSFSDVFVVMTALFAGLALFAPLMKRPPALSETSSGH